jgi:hypothetical protein
MGNKRDSGELKSYLLAAIDEAFDKRSWHGTNLRGSLRGLDAKTAAWRPAGGRHNIWEIAVHAGYWKYTVRRKLTGEKRGSFPLKGSSWFGRPVEMTEAAWKQDVQLLVNEHGLLRRAIEAKNFDGLPAKTLFLLRGITAHDLHHAGQIQILKRMCSGSA